jgi:hypothetical protein
MTNSATTSIGRHSFGRGLISVAFISSNATTVAHLSRAGRVDMTSAPTAGIP